MSTRRLVITGILSAGIGVLAFFMVPKPLPELWRQELMAEVQSGNVREVVIIDKEVLTAVSSTRGKFRVLQKPGDDSLIEELTGRGVGISYETSAHGLI